jgi:hypothetical protein
MSNFNMGRCNYSGHETGGPKHLLGGIYPASHEGPQKWICENPATHRAIMVCTLNGCRGEPMAICDRCHWNIQYRMSDMCTRCAFPPEARGWQEEIDSAQWELHKWYVEEKRAWDDPHCAAARRRIEAGRVHMDELWQSGRIKKIPMKVLEVA